MIVGIGTDIVAVERLARLRQQRGERFLSIVFTPDELARCLAKAGVDERLAVRFAAKEATMKALGTGWRQGVHFKQIEVRVQGSGKPELVLTGEALRRARQLGATTFHVSLSHERENALAVVILEGEPGAAEA